jgi:transposase
MTRAIDTLALQIGELTKTLAPSLLALFGCGSLTAAKLFAETAGIGRFRSRAAYASHTGTAPHTSLVGQPRATSAEPG